MTGAEATARPADPLTPRPSYHPEEGAPDPRSEWFGIARALLYALLVTAFLTWLIFLWVGSVSYTHLTLPTKRIV